MNNEPEWLTRARAEGRVLSESGVRLAGPPQASSQTLGTGKAPCGPLAAAAHAALRNAVTEKEFTKAVIEEAHFYGWMVAHFRPSMTGRKDPRTGRPVWTTAVQADGAGFPDTIIAKAGAKYVIAAELKVASKKKKGGVNPLSREQQAWLAALGNPHVLAVCWTPADWPEIVQALKEG